MNKFRNHGFEHNKLDLDDQNSNGVGFFKVLTEKQTTCRILHNNQMTFRKKCMRRRLSVRPVVSVLKNNFLTCLKIKFSIEYARRQYKYRKKFKSFHVSQEIKYIFTHVDQ